MATRPLTAAVETKYGILSPGLPLRILHDDGETALVDIGLGRHPICVEIPLCCFEKRARK